MAFRFEMVGSMTVQDLIDKLNEVSNKDIDVLVDDGGRDFLVTIVTESIFGNGYKAVVIS